MRRWPQLAAHAIRRICLPRDRRPRCPPPACSPCRLRTEGRRGLFAAIAVVGALVALGPRRADRRSRSTSTLPGHRDRRPDGLTAQLTLTNNTSQTPATVCNAGECSASRRHHLHPVVRLRRASRRRRAPRPTPASSRRGDGTFPLGAAARARCSTALRRRRRRRRRGASCGSSRRRARHAVVLGPGAAADGRLRDHADVQRHQAARRSTPAPAAGVQTLQSASAARARSDGGRRTSSRPARSPGTTVPPGTVTTAAPAAAVIPPPPVPPPVAVPPPPPVIQPADLDHFKCYEALQPNFRQRTVGTRDQFGQRRARVLRTRQLCNPVSKNGGKVLQPRAHLVCYETRDTGNPTLPRTVARDEPVRPAQADDGAPEPAVRAVAEAQDGRHRADDAEPDAAARPLPLLRRPAAAGDRRR